MNCKEVIKRMGTPEEIAEDFNHNFSDEDKKKRKKNGRNAFPS